MDERRRRRRDFFQNIAIVLLTLCSRASIEGGVSSAVAYTLNDYYMQMIEDCQVKLQDTLQKIINDSNGGMICIII